LTQATITKLKGVVETSDAKVTELELKVQAEESAHEGTKVPFYNT
jgi:hypothetical protein